MRDWSSESHTMKQPLELLFGAAFVAADVARAFWVSPEHVEID